MELLSRVRLHDAQNHIHLLLERTIDFVHRKVARKHTSRSEKHSITSRDYTAKTLPRACMDAAAGTSSDLKSIAQCYTGKQ